MRHRAAIFLHLPWGLHEACAKKKERLQMLHSKAYEHVRTRSRLASVALGAFTKLMRVMQTLGPHAYMHAIHPSPHCEGSVNRQKLRRIHRRTGDSMPHSLRACTAASRVYCCSNSCFAAARFCLKRRFLSLLSQRWQYSHMGPFMQPLWYRNAHGVH